MSNSCLICLLVLFFVPNSQQTRDTTWILASDPTTILPFWLPKMSRTGDTSSWSLKKQSENSTLKINLQNNNFPDISLSIILVLNSTAEFSTELYQGDAQVMLIFLENHRIVKQAEAFLQLLVNRGKATLIGEQFYIWIALGNRQSVNYLILLSVVAVLILKGVLVIVFDGRFGASLLLFPGLLVYVLTFYRGLRESIDQIIFQSPWINATSYAFVLIAYIYLPYAVRIINVCKQLAFSIIPKRTILSQITVYFVAIIAIYFIFIDVSLLCLSILAVIQIFGLLKYQGKDQPSYMISLNIIDILLLFYMQYYPLHRHQLILAFSYQVLVAIIVVFQLYILIGQRHKVEKKQVFVGKKKK